MTSGSSSALRNLLRLGLKYGPLALEGVRRTRGPAQDLAARQVVRRNARAAAMEHADHLIDGSVLPVYAGDERVWVVFSGDVPVGSHPVVKTPLATLLLHYDLSKRIRPDDVAIAAAHGPVPVSPRAAAPVTDPR